MSTTKKQATTHSKPDTKKKERTDPSRFGEFRLIKLTQEQELASISALKGESDSLIDEPQPFLVGCSFSKSTKAAIRALNGTVQGLLFHEDKLIASTTRKSNTVEGVYMFDVGNTQYDVEVAMPISVASYNATQKYGKHGEYMK